VPRLAFDDQGSEVFWSDLPGRTPTRVFIHGMGGIAWAAFGHIAGHPSMGGHRSIVVDLPGHGLSDRPAGWGYSLDDHAAVVAGICRHLGLAAIDVVGHSLGGDIAVVLADRNPGLVRRLVIAEANLDPLPPSPTADRYSQRIAAQTEADFVASGYRNILETVPFAAPTLRLCDARAVYRSAVGIVTHVRPTGRELLETLTIPRTFIRGELGEPLRDPAGLEAAGVNVVTIPRAGHLMMDDEPAAFVEALVSGLEPELPAGP
jgi:pimeloyl-ACP methyl ester carboxylesterase